MAIETLLGRATDEQLKKLPGRVRNPDRVKQHLDAFALHLQGVSYRGIQQHFGWKSLSSAENSVKRGEILAKNLNLDSEKIRLKLALFFEEICDITLAQRLGLCGFENFLGLQHNVTLSCQSAVSGSTIIFGQRSDTARQHIAIC